MHNKVPAAALGLATVFAACTLVSQLGRVCPSTAEHNPCLLLLTSGCDRVLGFVDRQSGQTRRLLHGAPAAGLVGAFLWATAGAGAGQQQHFAAGSLLVCVCAAEPLWM